MTTPIGLWVALTAAATDTEATVTEAGVVNATGNVDITTLSNHTNSVLDDSSSIKGGVAASVAVDVIQSVSDAQVPDTAVLHVGGQLNVIANNVQADRDFVRSASGQEGGKVAVAITVHYAGNQTEAYVDGNATAGGDVNVNATQDFGKVKFNKTFVVPTFGSGIFVQAGAGQNTLGDLLDDTKSAAIGQTIGRLGKAVFAKIVAAVSSDEAKGEESSVFDGLPSLEGAGALGVAVDTNDVEARIGDGTVANGVKSRGNVSVQSLLNTDPTFGVQGNVDSNPTPDKGQEAGSAGEQFAGSAAIGAAVYLDTSHATISAGSTVDAAKNLTVNATATHDAELFPLESTLTAFTAKPAKFTTSDGTVMVPNGSIAQVDKTYAGGENNGAPGEYYQYLGNSTTPINLATEDFVHNGDWKDVGSKSTYSAYKYISDLSTKLNGSLGEAQNATNWSDSTATGNTELAIAGNLLANDETRDVQAVIGAAAQINQDPAYRTGTQAVSVTASNTNEAFDVNGNINTQSIQGNTTRFSLDLAVQRKAGSTLGFTHKPLYGSSTNQEEGSAIGIAAGAYVFESTTKATIGDGVNLYADSLNVTANNKIHTIDLTKSGGDAMNVGFNGSMDLNITLSTTIASISGDATIVVGSTPVGNSDAPNASAIVSANDETIMVSIAGDITGSEEVAIGAGVSANFLKRDTEAYIGQSAEDSSTPAGKAPFTAGGDVYVNVRNGGVAGLFAIAGTKTANNPEPQTPATGLPKSDGSGETSDPNQLPSAQSNFANVLAELKTHPKFVSAAQETGAAGSAGANEGKAGVAISGAVTLNFLLDSARAYVRNGGVLKTTGQLLLNASNTTFTGGFAGAVALALNDENPEARNVGIAGALGANFVSGTTDAFVDGATSVNAAGLDFTAGRTGIVAAVVAGASGAVGLRGRRGGRVGQP